MNRPTIQQFASLLRRPTAPGVPANDQTAALVPATLDVTPHSVEHAGGHAATLIVTGYPDTLPTAWLDQLLSWPGLLDLSIHIDPVPAAEAAAKLRTQRARLEATRRTDADRGRIDQASLAAAADDAAELADGIARNATRLFTVGVYLTIHAPTADALVEATTQLRAGAAALMLDLQPATWRQRHGWQATLPLGVDPLRHTRTLDTTALAAALPHTSPDLPTPLPGPVTNGAERGVFYGLNLTTGNPVWWDRWSQDNHNSITLARSGAGKTYLTKLDLVRNLYQGVHASVIDPEGEYTALAAATGGVTIHLGDHHTRLNPFDLPAGDTRPDTLTRRILFLHTFVALLAGQTLTAAQRAGLDQALTAAYTAAGITPDPATWRRPAPLLADLQDQLSGSDTNRELADALAPYTTGSHSRLFAEATTTVPHGHLVTWSMRHLPDELRPVATVLALDTIWRTVDHPTRRPDERHLVVVDEAWQLLRDHHGAATWLATLAKQARKRATGLALVTQDADDVLTTALGRTTVANAATQMLLRQTPHTADALAEALGLTATERQLLTTLTRGEALLLGGPHHVAFTALATAEEHDIITTGLGLNET